MTYAEWKGDQPVNVRRDLYEHVWVNRLCEEAYAAGLVEGKSSMTAPRMFALTCEEQAKAAEWVAAQEEKTKTTPNRCAIGGRFEYTFMPTAIGVFVGIVDLATGEKLTLSDLDTF